MKTALRLREESISGPEKEAEEASWGESGHEAPGRAGQ